MKMIVCDKDYNPVGYKAGMDENIRFNFREDNLDIEKGV